MGIMEKLFGGGTPKFKPSTHQTVEIEFEDMEGEFQSYFVEILEVNKKRLTLRTPGNAMNPVHISPSQPITISYFDEPKDMYFSYQGLVKDSRDQEFDVDSPGKDITATKIDPRDEDFQVQVSIPVKYQAHRSVHSQVATTHSVTPHSFFLRTNLGIPPQTELRVVLEIPNTSPVDIDGKATGSEKDPDDNRKHISQVQFQEINPDDRDAILNYAVYYEQRSKRAAERGDDS